MHDATFRVPTPINEPVLNYTPGSQERALLDAELARAGSEVVEIPCIVGGKRIETGRIEEVRNPCDKNHVLARFHCAGEAEVKAAIEAGCTRARAAGKTAGAMTLDDELIEAYRDAGANFLSIGLDTNLLAKATDALAARWVGKH